jgi:hypothetical protein
MLLLCQMHAMHTSKAFKPVTGPAGVPQRDPHSVINYPALDSALYGFQGKYFDYVRFRFTIENRLSLSRILFEKMMMTGQVKEKLGAFGNKRDQ